MSTQTVFVMPHFVSASCEGQVCYCGKPASHKVGEEIPHDEPCIECGEVWRYANFGGDVIHSAKPCNAIYHHSVGSPRHNLTSYVCCLCYTKLLGAATGCTFDDVESRALANYRYAREKDPGFGPPAEVTCPRCNGVLVATGLNQMDTIMFLDCENCGICCQVAYKPKA